MIRERQINSIAFSAGQTNLIDLPRDAVFHWLTLSCFGGSHVSTQGSSGTGPTYDSAYPFSIMRNIRLIRNGSDVIWQGTGAQLAKEHYYLNRTAPFARLYSTSSNVETLYTATARTNMTVPANADGINSSCVLFKATDAASSSSTNQFDFQVDLYLQVGVDDAYIATLVDARPLATFQLEIMWATTAQLFIPGTANTSDAITATVNILSIDQDNMDADQPFGTFKRSSQQYSNIPFNTSNYQVMLPRGNYFFGIQISTFAYKTASTVIASPEDAVLSLVDNRINSNFSLRKFAFNQLQAKNVGDYGGRSQPYSSAQGMPQGHAYLYYPVAGQSMAELVATYVMDQFDMQLTTNPIGSAQNGVTTASTNPIINLLLQEVVPGVNVSASAPRGSQSGSSRRTSAKPYGS